MSMNCAPLLTYFSIHVRRNSFKSSTWEERVFLWLSVWYFSVSVDGSRFHMCVGSICPHVLEFRDTAECSTSATYLDVFLILHTGDRLASQLHDKQEDFSFSTVGFPRLCGDVPVSPAHGLGVFWLIWCVGACSTYGRFFIRGSLLADRLVG
jgi:hypothetical protein